MRSQPAIALAIAVAALGCAGPPERIDPRVTVVEGALAVDEHSLTFARADVPAVRPGDLLVSRQGEGFLRRVLAVRDDGERVLLDTEPAALGDAIVDGDVTDSLRLAEDGKWDSHALPAIQVDVREQKAVDNAAVTVLVHRAALALRPTLDLDLSMRSRRLDRFEAVLTSQLDADLDLDVRARAGTIRPTIRLWKSAPMLFYQQVGPVPVVETATISIGVRLEITARGDSRVRLVGSLRSAIAAGLRYQNGAWQRVAEGNHTLSGRLPAAELEVDEIDVRAYLFAQLDVKLYDVAGPFINVGPYVEVDHPLGSDSFAGKVGLYGEVGGELRVFGLRVPALPRFTLFDASQPVF